MNVSKNSFFSLVTPHRPPNRGAIQ